MMLSPIEDNDALLLKPNRQLSRKVLIDDAINEDDDTELDDTDGAFSEDWHVHKCARPSTSSCLANIFEISEAIDSYSSTELPSLDKPAGVVHSRLLPKQMSFPCMQKQSSSKSVSFSIDKRPKLAKAQSDSRMSQRLVKFKFLWLTFQYKKKRGGQHCAITSLGLQDTATDMRFEDTTESTLRDFPLEAPQRQRSIPERILARANDGSNSSWRRRSFKIPSSLFHRLTASSNKKSKK